MIDLELLIKNGVQFGHQTWRWNPKMKPFIWGQKNGVHLIDVTKTAVMLERAAVFLESVAAQGHSILWCGTKKSAQMVLGKVLVDVNSPVVTHRWIGGTLTNYSQVKKSVTKMLHLEDVLSKSEAGHYVKKELNHFQKLKDRLEKSIGGIRTLRWPVGAVVVADVRKDHVAVREAQYCGIPVVGLVDTNADPSGIDFVIPANDDAPKSLEVILDYLAQAAKRGQASAKAAAPATEEAVSDNTLERMLETVLKDEEDGGAKKQGAKRGPGAAGRRRSAPGRGGAPGARRPS